MVLMVVVVVVGRVVYLRGEIVGEGGAAGRGLAGRCFGRGRVAASSGRGRPRPRPRRWATPPEEEEEEEVVLRLVADESAEVSRLCWRRGPSSLALLLISLLCCRGARCRPLVVNLPSASRATPANLSAAASSAPMPIPLPFEEEVRPRNEGLEERERDRLLWLRLRPRPANEPRRACSGGSDEGW